MRRVPSPFKPDPNLDEVCPNDMGNGIIEDRHIGNDEILPSKIAMVEAKVAVPFVIDFPVTADATSGLPIFDEDAPFKFEVLEVIVRSKTASALGTIQVTDGALTPNPITDAIVCAVNKVVSRAGTIDSAFSVVPKNGSLLVFSNGSTDRGLVTIIAVKRD